MNADLLLDNLGAIAAGPGGVDRVREVILQLAVQGNLGTQDPTDESASVLLDSIRRDKEQLVSGGKIKRDGNYRPIKKDEIPFPIPQSWQWIRLGEITQKIGSGSTPRGGRAVYQTDGIKFIRSQNVWNDGLYLEGIARISDEIHRSMASTIVQPQDILLNITGASIGRSSLVPDDFDEGNVNQHVSIIRTVDNNTRYFLHYCIISQYFQNTIMDVQVGMSREGLSKKVLKDLLIPLPPLAEQHRIVEKVDRLMALCDGLEARQRAEREERRRLRTASLAALEEAATAEEAERAWAHVSGEFGRLVDTLEDVTELRKSILQLAIRGQLGTRSENDEPANILLRHLIGQNPARRERQECAKKDDISSLPVLPSGWVWTYVHCVGAVRLGRQRAPEHHYGPFMRPYLRVANVYEDRIDTSDVLEMNFTPSEYETYRLEYGDVLLNEGQSRELVGRPAIYRDEVPGACFQNTLVRFRPFKPILSEYALTVFRAYLHSGRFQKKSQQTVNIAHLSAGRFAAMKFPLPPFAEQHRIVEKINQLMTQCDTLEAGILARDAALEAFAGAACRAVLGGPAADAGAPAVATGTGQQRLPV